MIRSSLLSSLFSATLHGGVMAAVAWNVFEGEMSSAPVSTVQVIFQEPSLQEASVLMPLRKKLQGSSSKEKNEFKLPVQQHYSLKEAICSSQSSGDSPTEVGYIAEGFSNPLPKYPLVARKRGHEGEVSVRVRVAEAGQIINVILIKSSGWDDLDQTTLDILESWQFKPATRGGKPVAGSIDLRFNFRLSAGKVNLN